MKKKTGSEISKYMMGPYSVLPIKHIGFNSNSSRFNSVSKTKEYTPGPGYYEVNN